MRIAFYGNICNNLYQIAKALRRSPDFDAHLYVDEAADAQQRPESDDPELAGAYPEWIHVGRYRSPRTMLAPWTSPLVPELDRFDLAVVSSFGPMYAQFSRTPSAFLTSGGDLTVYPFPIRFQFQHRSLRDRLGWGVVGVWQRRGVRSCDQVWTQPFRPFLDALDRLGVRDVASSAYFPVMMDTDRFCFEPEAAASELDAARQLERASFVVFHPSRLMIRAHPALRETGQWKRNDLLIEAFAHFVHEVDAPGAVLAFIERSVSGDIELAKELTRRLGIEDRVLWLKPPRPFGFHREELRVLYSLSDVVADDFGAGWFGSVALEGMSTGRPVVSYVDEAVMGTLYPWHPFLSANTREGIAEILARLHDDEAYREEEGRRSRDFVERFHSPEAVGTLYVEQIQALTAELRRV